MYGCIVGGMRVVPDHWEVLMDNLGFPMHDGRNMVGIDLSYTYLLNNVSLELVRTSQNLA